MSNAPTLADIKRTLRQHLPELRQRYSVASLALFGSYVRREQRSDSDLDILVTFDETPGLLKFVELENELSDMLGIKDDLVVEDALKPRIGERGPARGGADMTERTYVDHLEDILDATEKAQRFVEGLTYETFVDDEKTVFAVIRALEVVGEATKRIPNAVRERHPSVPWRLMAGMRDKLIHDYINVNLRRGIAGGVSSTDTRFVPS